ncbi:MAG: MFS transporter [Actinobacteria bacterium]|nr:MFS transporter [Actinomycetota bacterium]
MGRGVLGDRYWRLWSAVTASAFGNGLTVTALALLVVSRTADPMAVAVLFALADAPAFVVAIVGGRAIDRSDRRRVLIAMDVVRGVLLVGLALAVVAGWTAVWFAYAVVLLTGVASLTFDVAAQAMIPALTPRSRWHAANGWMYAAEDGMKELIGPPAGAGLFAVTPALPFVASALVITSIPGRYPPDPDPDVAGPVAPAAVAGPIPGVADPPAEARADPGPEVAAADRTDPHHREALRAVVRHPMWRMFSACWALVGVANGVAFATLVLFVTETLGASALTYGLISAAVGVGLIVGGVIAERVLEPFGPSARIWVPILLAGSLYALVATAGSPGILGGLLVAWGFAAALLNTAVAVLRQERIPQAVFGRVVSRLNLWLRGGVVVGAVAGGLIASAWGMRAPWLVAGAIQIAVAAVAARALTFDRD